MTLEKPGHRKLAQNYRLYLAIHAFHSSSDTVGTHTTLLILREINHLSLATLSDLIYIHKGPVGSFVGVSWSRTYQENHS
jgi:hypothetical protein